VWENGAGVSLLNIGAGVSLLNKWLSSPPSPGQTEAHTLTPYASSKV